MFDLVNNCKKIVVIPSEERLEKAEILNISGVNA